MPAGKCKRRSGQFDIPKDSRSTPTILVARTCRTRGSPVRGVMMKHKVMAGALAGVFAAASLAAHAADLPPRPPYTPPPAVVVPAYNWTGIYIGVNGGYGWGR